MHKVISKSKTGMLQLVEVGQPDSQAKWYSLVDKCKSFAERTKSGDIVTISSKNENGGSLISFIKKESGSSSPSPVSNDSFTPPILDDFSKAEDQPNYNQGWSKQEKEKYGKEEAERKNRQGTIGAVATIVASLGFTKDDSVDEIVRVMSDIYTKLSAKLNSINTVLVDAKVTVKTNDVLPKNKKEELGGDDLGDPISLDDDLMADAPMQEVNLGDDDVPF